MMLKVWQARGKGGERVARKPGKKNSMFKPTGELETSDFTVGLGKEICLIRY